jgi:hypothetical protein
MLTPVGETAAVQRCARFLRDTRLEPHVTLDQVRTWEATLAGTTHGWSLHSLVRLLEPEVSVVGTLGSLVERRIVFHLEQMVAVPQVHPMAEQARCVLQNDGWHCNEWTLDGSRWSKAGVRDVPLTKSGSNGIVAPWGRCLPSIGWGGRLYELVHHCVESCEVCSWSPAQDDESALHSEAGCIATRTALQCLETDDVTEGQYGDAKAAVRTDKTPWVAGPEKAWKVTVPELACRAGFPAQTLAEALAYDVYNLSRFHCPSMVWGALKALYARYLAADVNSTTFGMLMADVSGALEVLSVYVHTGLVEDTRKLLIRFVKHAAVVYLCGSVSPESSHRSKCAVKAAFDRSYVVSFQNGGSGEGYDNVNRDGTRRKTHRGRRVHGQVWTTQQPPYVSHKRGTNTPLLVYTPNETSHRTPVKNPYRSSLVHSIVIR